MLRQHDEFVRKPFDLYQLHLFRRAAELGSFTAAAQASGLTQSAITRQIQSIERQLDVLLFRRTTRSVVLTAAGRFLLDESQPLLGEVDALLRRLREDFANAPREVRVGVSRNVSLAYLPGFFSANVRLSPAVLSRVVHESNDSILAALESDTLDIGVLPPPVRLSKRLRVTHRFADQFTLIANADRLAADRIDPRSRAKLARWLETQPWLAVQEATETGHQIRKWLKQQRLNVRTALDLDNFDLIITLVTLGVGVSVVPQRALALYSRKQSLVRLPWPHRFVRDLVVIVRRQSQTPEHIQRFVENILF